MAGTSPGLDPAIAVTCDVFAAGYEQVCTMLENNEVRPFDGIRVIDATHVLAGPFATYQLALLGLRYLLSNDRLFLGRGGRQRLGIVVIDQLHIDIGVAPEYRQPRPRSRSADLLTDPEFNFLSSE